MAKCEPQLTSN